MIKELAFEAVFGTEKRKIKIVQAHQSANMGLHLYENNYYCGMLEKKDKEWRAHLNDKSLEEFTADDLTALGKLIDESNIFDLE